MKKLLCALSAGVIAFSLAACGDNKTKAKLVGTEVVSASTLVPPVPRTPNGAVATVAVQSANLAASVASVGIKTSIALAPGKEGGVRQESALIDGEGFWNLGLLYPSQNGLQMKFWKDDVNYYTELSTSVLNAPVIDARVSPVYSGLGLTGMMRVKQSVTPEEIESGTLTGTDSLGGTYTLTFSHVQYAPVSASLGLPTGGTMTIDSSSGCSGTFAFSVANSAYAAAGTMTYQGRQASVSLAYDGALGKYAGSYTDDTGTFAVR